MSWGEQLAFMENPELLSNWWKFSSSRLVLRICISKCKTGLAKNTMLRPKKEYCGWKISSFSYNYTNPFEIESCWP
uniref:Uncharacterized protein n=1 Tax=Salix viminalis TaxID=40686 RepID=A0A6N2MZ86_SALVM